MMKKILSLVIVGMMAASSASAQNDDYYRHEVGVTIGSGATTEIFSGLANLTEMLISATVTSAVTGGMGTGYYNYGDEKYIPTITAEYYYHVNKWLGLGGFLAFNGLDRDMYAEWTNNTNDNHYKEKTGQARRRNLSIIPTAKFDWLRKKYFGMYSKLGMGVSFMHESQKDDVDGGLDYSDTETIFNVQVSLLGIEAGSRNIRGFVELGMGEQGILLAGLRYKF